jgi:hypothetical protein
MRERVMMNRSFYDSSNTEGDNFLYDENGDIKPFIENMSLNDFIDYLFLTALQRKASASEKADLIDVYETGVGGNQLTTDDEENKIVRDGRHDDVAQITFDYITRLPEFYYFRSVN